MFIVYGCVTSSILFSVHCHCLPTLIKAIDSVGDPPLPIPNREVKPDSADGTANVCGRVGHRHFYRREFQEIGALFFAVNPPCQLGPLVLQTFIYILSL